MNPAEIREEISKSRKRVKDIMAPEQIKQALEAVDDLVETDFCYDMDLKTMPKSKPYTQAEARKMAELLGQIYLHAHKLHCTACRGNS